MHLKDLSSIVSGIILRILLLCGLGLLAANPARAQVEIKLLLTSNIQGKAFLNIENQEVVDPLLVLAQNIQAERRAGADLYLDLGNAFYPGVLSRFSSGSIVTDFFDDLACEATLVSSKDLHIGLDSMDFLQKKSHVRLLSANIARTDGPAFKPYFVADVRGTRVAFVGVSSKNLGFDIAEKDLYGITVKDEKEALDPVLKEIGASGVRHIVLLSGLKLSDTLGLMTHFPQIDLALSGGDYSGVLYDGKASRLDLTDGRSIVMLEESFDYYIVDLVLDDHILFRAMHPRKALPIRTTDGSYREFVQRLTLWKQRYLAEQNQPIVRTGENAYVLDDFRLTQLLRDRYNCELAVVDKNTINTYPISRDVLKSDFLRLVNLDYNIFTFALTGEQLKSLERVNTDLVVTGWTRGQTVKVQGYPLEPKRKYRVAATQSAFEKIQYLLGKDLDYRNSWKTVTELMIADLENEKVLLRSDYAYLERRFRVLVDVYLANFITTVHVDRGDSIETPTNQPYDSYREWGLEDKIDVSFYNEKHRFVLTPYLFYVRQEDDYLQNLLRGTVLYDYNLNENWRPYNKFQCDTVVESVQGLRPMLIRETAGISAYWNYFNGKLGLGFEKKVKDPTDNAQSGLELIMGIKYPFLKYFTYEMLSDNFASLENEDGGRWGLRSEFDNAISARINNYLSVSFKYKYFYFYDDEIDERYQSSQLITSLNVITDWKIW
jgi:2',3'-cyclic-nucleotide 2'-phosphodiesterase (5'-nucleotidase family)